MQSHPDFVSFPIPLGYTVHKLAENFASQQADLEKAKQVYFNTLAVYTVNIYLNCMGMEVDLTASDSWNPIVQSLMDIADLQISQIGKLECRPVLASNRYVYIPPEVWTERIGYVVVQINDSLTEGLLVGFTKTAQMEQLPINELSSIEGLLEYLIQIRQAKMQIELNQWFENNFTDGWEPTKALYARNSASQPINIRSTEPLVVNESDSRGGISGGKLIDLGIQIYQQPLALVVTVVKTTEKERNVLVQVTPGRGTGNLPQGVGLIVSDESGAYSMDTISRQRDLYIQLEFNAEIGEIFSAKVTFGEASLIQYFLL
jgi:hypothetical protein